MVAAIAESNHARGRAIFEGNPQTFRGVGNKNIIASDRILGFHILCFVDIQRWISRVRSQESDSFIDDLSLT